jgi:hypothetical protein
MQIFRLKNLRHFSSILMQWMLVEYPKEISPLCLNSCSGDCAPRNLTAQISGSGAVTYVWLDPVDVVSTVDEYFVSFSSSSTGPWTSVQGFLFAQYPAFYDAPPCDTTMSSNTCNRGRLQGLSVGTTYFLRVSAGRCCNSFLDTVGCETCSSLDYSDCQVSGSVSTSIVAMGMTFSLTTLNVGSN